MLIWLVCGAEAALAVQVVRVPADVDAIDLSSAVDHYSAQGDKLQISTAPAADGIVRRIEVGAVQAGGQPSWIVFALTNDTDEQLVRLIVAPHFRLVGSGVVWPDLGASRITTITASQGNAPEREDRVDADVFRLTLDPGSTVTYVAELRTPNLPQIYLWEPDAFKDRTASLTLYQGIVIGIAGLLALFLTMVFVVRGALIFPASAALAWTVFAYVCIDFGFWRKIFAFEDEAERIWRASAEATLAATLIIFLFAYLNLRRWHVRFSHIAIVWFLMMAGVVALAIYNAPIAAGVARISIASIAGIGFLLILSMAARGFDRAIMLIPTWFVLCIWVVAAAFTVTGRLSGDLVSPGLIGGLVLIVMLIGFTVMQNAFSGSSFAYSGVADMQRRALAMTGCGDSVFDWNVVSDQIYVSAEIENQLGVRRGALEGPASAWLEILHPLDRDRYAASLDGVLQQRSGRINHDIRLRAADGHYFWFVMKARPVVNAEGEVIRIVGALTDVTEIKTAEERMMHDAVHDNLTGLPNKELFYDRLDTALLGAQRAGAPTPAVVLIDVDRFRQINVAVGRSFGDSVLLTVARRLSRNLAPGDTLARLSGDRFGAIVMTDGAPDRIASFVEAIRSLLATPISFGEREVQLTVSIGTALFEAKLHAKGGELIRDAEIALANAKKVGGNHAETFAPAMRAQRSDRLSLEADLRRSLERGEIQVFFQPIVRLEDRTVAGFEALLRWRHPRLGLLGPAEFNSLAEETGIIVDIGVFAMEKTARELAAWQRALEVTPPIFASINVSSRQMLRHDLLADVKAALTRNQVTRGSFKLELTESLVMENPEYAAQMLRRIREVGAGLTLDDFGAGYSSLAHLERYHFDTLKIDASLVRPNGVGGRPVILRSVIAMAHDLGMDIVTEGAETESDAVELSQLGCEFAQGVAFGQPMTAAEARRLMGAEVG